METVTMIQLHRGEGATAFTFRIFGEQTLGLSAMGNNA